MKGKEKSCKKKINCKCLKIQLNVTANGHLKMAIKCYKLPTGLEKESGI